MASMVPPGGSGGRVGGSPVPTIGLGQIHLLSAVQSGFISGQCSNTHNYSILVNHQLLNTCIQYMANSA